MCMRWFVSFDKGIGLTVIVLADRSKESEANLHYYTIQLTMY